MSSRKLPWLVALVLAAGCDVYDESLVQGGSGFGKLPPRPSADTSSPDDSETLVFAISNVILNQGGDLWRSIGLDLDGLNTTAPSFPRECTPTENINPIVDGHGGIDNAFGALLWPIVNTTLSSLPCEIKQSHDRGHGTLLLRVENWNGESNDSRVRVTMAPAIDGSSVEDPSLLEFDGFDLVFASTGEPAPEPAWEGADQFFLNPRAFNGGNPESPKVTDPNGYIADDVIVMTLPVSGAQFELIMENRSVPIVLNQGYIVAPMSEDRQSVTRGFVAGRYPLQALTAVGPSIGVCSEMTDGGVDENPLTAIYATYADVLETVRIGAPDETLECGAVSMAVGFDAIRANWAGLAPTAREPPIYCEEQPPIPEGCR